MKNLWKMIGLSALMLVVGRGPAMAQNPTELPSLPGALTYPLDVNSSGLIVGNTYNRFTYESLAVQWVNGEISVLPGYPASFVSGLNDSGLIVGGARKAPEGDLFPIVWENGVPRELPTLGRGGVALDINANGDIVGWVNTDQFTAPAVWRGGQLTILNSLSEIGGQATSIDNNGLISGFSQGTQGDQFPTQWVAEIPVPLPVSFGEDYIGVLGVYRTGAGRTSGYLIQKRALEDGSQYLISTAVGWQNGEFRVLQRSNDMGNSYAYDVNGKGVFVGATTSLDGYRTPTLWEEDGDTRLPIDAGREAIAAGANEDGLVVGVDTTEGLNPIPVIWDTRTFPRIRMQNMQSTPGSPVVLEASVRTAGAPVANRTVTFQAQGRTIGTARTDSRGVARMNYRLPSSARNKVDLMASLGGSNYVFRKIEITKAATTVGVAATQATRSRPMTFQASLRKTETNAPAGYKRVVFLMDNQPVATGVTDSRGIARSTFRVPSTMAVGQYPIEVRYFGDSQLKPATGRATVTILR
ncbi:MAG: hypothetical protein ACOYON_14415 [Fimbriimonas sp.]